MADFSGTDANVALVNFLVQHGAELPDHIRGPIQEAVAGVDGLGALVAGVEGLYAIRDELGDEGRELLLDLTRFVTARGFLGYNRGAGRGAAILVAAERIAVGGPAIVEREVEPGEGDEPEKVLVEGDPEVEHRFVLNPPPAEPVEPPAPPRTPGA